MDSPSGCNEVAIQLQVPFRTRIREKETGELGPDNRLVLRPVGGKMPELHRWKRQDLRRSKPESFFKKQNIRRVKSMIRRDGQPITGQMFCFGVKMTN